MSTLGWTHVVFAVVALLAGAAVLLISKGTRWHRTLGHVYLTSMIGLNVTALFVYDLYGRFGPFHWMAVGSLISLIAGMVPVFTRQPKGRWLERHALFITISYIGLVAATAAEIASRLPRTEGSFGLVVAGTSLLVIGFGAVVLHRRLPSSVRRTPDRFRKASG